MSAPRTESELIEELTRAYMDADATVRAATAERHIAREALQAELVRAEVERLNAMGCHVGQKVIVERGYVFRNETKFEEAFLDRVYTSGTSVLWGLKKIKKDGTASRVNFTGSAKNLTPWSPDALETLNKEGDK